MAGKRTASDDLKQFFAENGLGPETDWKRVSKKKNGEGQWVRTFENRKTGGHIEVIDLGGSKHKVSSLSVSANDAFSKEVDAIAHVPVIDADKARNALADKIIGDLFRQMRGEEVDETDADAQVSLARRAGKALANRFIFALGNDPDIGLYACIAPAGDQSFDGHLSHLVDPLLPPSGYETREEAEATFSFMDYADPLKLASDLLKRGFVWDAGFQRDIDGNTGDDMMSALKPIAEAMLGATAGKPKAPGPKT